MRILFHTDSHFKYRASMSQDNPNLLLGDRLTSLVKSYRYMYDYAKNNDVDLIINGGDILDKPNISSEESLALELALSYDKDIPEIILVGNHDRKSNTVHALDILSIHPRIRIADKPDTIAIGDLSFGVLPFNMNFDNTEIFDLLSNTNTKLLFSHVDMIGTRFGGVVSTNGYDPEILKDKFNYVFNGHIHTYGEYNERVINTGSLSATGLGDNYEKLPGFTIIDIDNTSKLVTNITHVDNPHTILYRTVEAEVLGDVISKVESYNDLPNPYYLRVVCKDSIKLDIKNYLESVGSGNQIRVDQSYVNRIINYRLVTKIERNSSVNVTTSNAEDIKVNSSPVEVLKEYISTVSDSKLPTERPTINKFVTREFTLGGSDHE